MFGDPLGQWGHLRSESLLSALSTAADLFAAHTQVTLFSPESAMRATLSVGGVRRVALPYDGGESVYCASRHVVSLLRGTPR